MPTDATLVPLPPELTTAAFEAAWADWLEYRRQRRLPKYTPIGLKRTLARVAAWGPDAAVAAIEYSMAQNWQGIFPAPQQRAAASPQDRALAAMRLAREGS